MPGVMTELHGRPLLVAACVSLVALVLSSGAMIGVLVSLPADYFVLAAKPDARRSAAALPYRIVKNLIGVVLVLAGIVMAIPGVPGQGILTLLAGLLLVEFPGQRKLVRRILERRAVLGAINKLRARFRRDPMIVD